MLKFAKLPTKQTKLSMNTSRRNFLGNMTAASAGTIALSGLPLTSIGKILGANDKIRFGTIGCKGMGFSNTRSLLKIENVECIALCDIAWRGYNCILNSVIDNRKAYSLTGTL